MHPRFLPSSLALSLAAALAACGGGDDPVAGSGGGTLTIAAANPAAHNGTVDLAKAKTIGNNARAVDGFSSTAYCEVFFEDATGSNGNTYAVQVYFRQNDKKALHVSVVGGPVASLWSVFDNASGNPITGVTVDTAAHTIVFANKVLAGSAGEAGTLSGTITFPANVGTPACG